MVDATQNQDITNQNTNAAAQDTVPGAEKDDAALWKEFDTAEAGAAAATDATNDQPSDTDGNGTGDEQAAAAATDVKSKDSAAPADKAQSAGDGNPPPAAQAQTDIWASAPPELKAAYEAVAEQAKKGEQYRRSNEGRLAAAQRRIDELSRTAALPKATDKGKGADAATTDDAALQALAEEYPDLAKPLVEEIFRLREATTLQGKELSAIGTERRQAALNEQAELLTQQHPDWQDVTADPRIRPWLDNQPRHIREALLRNANEIVDAEEAADVVGRFKAYLAIEAAPGNAHNTNAQAGASAGKGSETPQVLTGKRKQQLEGASSARSRGPGVASGISEDGDPEHIWKQFDEQERRQARRA
jgi:hypothetical protein